MPALQTKEEVAHAGERKEAKLQIPDPKPVAGMKF